MAGAEDLDLSSMSAAEVLDLLPVHERQAIMNSINARMGSAEGTTSPVVADEGEALALGGPDAPPIKTMGPPTSRAPASSGIKAMRESAVASAMPKGVQGEGPGYRDVGDGAGWVFRQYDDGRLEIIKGKGTGRVFTSEDDPDRYNSILATLDEAAGSPMSATSALEWLRPVHGPVEPRAPAYPAKPGYIDPGEDKTGARIEFLPGYEDGRAVGKKQGSM